MVHIHVSHNTQNQPKHLPKLGWFIYLLAIAAMIGGFLYGYNSGVVSPALIYLQQDDDMKPMKVFWQELVISITPVGALICAFAFSKWSLLIGRIFIGLGLGLSSMTVPIYVGEASPLHIRGKLLTCYQLFLGTGIVAGNVVGGGLSYVNPVQIGWRYYTTNIIKADGVKDPHTTIWISVGTAFMNLIGIIVPMFLIERLGRRKILLGSVIGTFISLLLLGAGFLVMNKTSADVIILSSSNRMFNSTTKNYDTSTVIFVSLMKIVVFARRKEVKMDFASQ
uniref:Major facilitator superfamily (MFS) profile domain-containing protein n=1 Tax=Acrobeloides nanus TaxID=290746 RepID=A0A914EFX5_9BILA